MHATMTSRSRPKRAVCSAQQDAPLVSELRQELALVHAQRAMLAAEVERMKQVCCPWQAYSWHRWPH